MNCPDLKIDRGPTACPGSAGTCPGMSADPLGAWEEAAGFLVLLQTLQLLPLLPFLLVNFGLFPATLCLERQQHSVSALAITSEKQQRTAK